MLHPRSETAVFGSLSDALHLVIEWVECVQGRGDITCALEGVLSYLKAESASLLRLHLDMAMQNTMARSGNGTERKPRDDSGLSFSQYLLGHGIGHARPGSLWYLSDFVHELEAEDGLAVRLGIAQDRTREIVAAVLEPRRTTSDILEISFTRHLSTSETEALKTIVNIASRAWRHRPQPGTDASSSGSILDIANPAGLSRSEYRVCSLVGRGMNAKGISASLRISESTVRSHLRSIYSKTKTNGQRELMYRLLNSAGQPGHPTLSTAAMADGFDPRQPSWTR